MNKKLPKLHKVGDYWVRPGDYLKNGATVVKEGVNFTIHSVHAVGMELLLFKEAQIEPFAVIPFPESYRIGDTYSMIVFDLDMKEFEYAFRVIEYAEDGVTLRKSPPLLDMYAHAVAGQSNWGKHADEGVFYKARVVQSEFDWGAFVQPEHDFKDLIIYEMHVRGFTRDKSSKVAHPGTFAGILDKLDYLLDLGVNAVELMPIFEFDELEAERYVDGKQLLNYWGYNTVSFFAPNTSYAFAKEHNAEGNELKEVIKVLNEHGIEVFLDVVFNHTAEGDDRGPTFSFKGYDKDIYYMATPEGYHYNFSGCGNTMNCNHPVVRQMILDCLRHWVVEYRVDGFRFDLASILGRDEDGAPMSDPPLLELLAYDPILSKVKLIAEAWDAGGLYQVGTFPSWKRWAEWNGRYRDDMRRFLKSDGGLSEIAFKRMTGSGDIYDPALRGDASVNFITCHDGFTLYDLYSYNSKHNEANGWNGTDGCNDNHSWNCGAEGETDDPEVNALRLKLRKNAFTALMMSRGAAMFLAGDEFGNTQFGNNNAYCQDNEISWLDWRLLKKNKKFHEYVKSLIAFRKSHAVVRGATASAACGFPDVSAHNTYAWNGNFAGDTRVFGIMYAGRKAGEEKDEVVFVAVNMYWETREQFLPEAPEGMKWKLQFMTDDEIAFFKEESKVVLPARSIAVLEVTE